MEVSFMDEVANYYVTPLNLISFINFLEWVNP